jgi:hypothetical protein
MRACFALLVTRPFLHDLVFREDRDEKVRKDSVDCHLNYRVRFVFSAGIWVFFSIRGIELGELKAP